MPTSGSPAPAVAHSTASGASPSRRTFDPPSPWSSRTLRTAAARGTTSAYTTLRPSPIAFTRAARVVPAPRRAVARSGAATTPKRSLKSGAQRSLAEACCAPPSNSDSSRESSPAQASEVELLRPARIVTTTQREIVS